MYIFSLRIYQYNTTKYNETIEVIIETFYTLKFKFTHYTKPPLAYTQKQIQSPHSARACVHFH